jgi:hypothetical protein
MTKKVLGAFVHDLVVFCQTATNQIKTRTSNDGAGFLWLSF